MALVDGAARPEAAGAGIFRLAAVLAFVPLVACNPTDDAGKPATQVAARVNSGEISIYQVNFALRHTPGLSPEQVSEVKRQVLDALVDQELAVQEAVAAKLDRDPNVMQTVDAARREILARAYMEQVTSAAPSPTVDDISTYYRSHPELFTGRKIYHLQQLDLPNTPEMLAMVREQLALGKSAAELETWFKDRQRKVSTRVVIKPAEKIDLDLLPKLAAMRDGQTALFQTGDEAAVITLLTAFPQPLGEDDAKPLIEQYLKRQRGETLEKETTRRLRAKAKIEYLGEFSPDAEATRKQKAAAAAREIEEAQAAREAARWTSAFDLDRPGRAAPGSPDSANGRPAGLALPAGESTGRGADLD